MSVATRAELLALRERLGPDGYRDAMRHACWRRGDLSYALNAPQLRLRDLWYANKERGVRRTVAKWARRVGKTRTCSVLAFESALRKPKARIPYGAQTQTAVREFVAPHFIELAEGAPEDMRPELVGNEMRFRNGSRIVLFGCDDQLKADRGRGPSADDAFVDEGGFIPVLGYVVRDVLRPQLSTTGGAMLLVSSPPEAGDHEFDAFALEAEERGAYLHYTVHDAPHLSRDEISAWCRDVGGEDSIAWKREGLAQSVTDPRRAVVPEFTEALLDKSRPIIGEIARPQHFHCYIVGDLGYVDLTHVSFAYFHYELDLLVIEDEVALRRPTSTDVQRAAEAKARELWGDRKPAVRKLDGPAITVADIARLERTDLERLEGEHDDPERWSTVWNGELGAKVNAWRRRVATRKVLISPRCRVLIAHNTHARWNPKRTSFERVQSEDGQHHYDGCASAVYLNHEIKVHVDPRPKLPPGISHLTHRIPDDINENGRKERLRRAFTPQRVRR